VQSDPQDIPEGLEVIVPIPVFETFNVLGPSQTEPPQTLPREQDAVAVSSACICSVSKLKRLKVEVP